MPAATHPSGSLPGGVSAALAPARAGFLGAAAFSCVINILGLTGSSLYVQIYDRVIPSRSISTLVALTVLAAALYAAFGVLDFLRGRILSRAGLMITSTLEREALTAVSALALSDSTRAQALEPLSDLDRIRTFLSGPGPSAILDLPWIPVYLAAIYILHPVLGMTVAAVALGLLLLAIVGEAATKVRRERHAAETLARTALAENVRHNAEISHAMGWGPASKPAGASVPSLARRSYRNGGHRSARLGCGEAVAARVPDRHRRPRRSPGDQRRHVGRRYRGRIPHCIARAIASRHRAGALARLLGISGKLPQAVGKFSRGADQRTARRRPPGATG